MDNDILCGLELNSVEEIVEFLKTIIQYIHEQYVVKDDIE